MHFLELFIVQALYSGFKLHIYVYIIYIDEVFITARNIKFALSL